MSPEDSQRDSAKPSRHRPRRVPEVYNGSAAMSAAKATPIRKWSMPPIAVYRAVSRWSAMGSYRRCWQFAGPASFRAHLRHAGGGTHRRLWPGFITFATVRMLPALTIAGCGRHTAGQQPAADRNSDWARLYTRCCSRSHSSSTAPGLPDFVDSSDDWQC